MKLPNSDFATEVNDARCHSKLKYLQTRLSRVANSSNSSNSMNWNFHHPIIVQGTTKLEYLPYISQMKVYGVDVVAGVSIGYQKTDTEEIPIFDLVENAIREIGFIGTSIICVPYDRVLDASLEAIASGIKQLIIATPDIPPLDTVKLLKAAENNDVLLLGPGSSGIIALDRYCLGTMQPQHFKAGNVGLIGYGETLLYEVAWALNEADLGQSIVVSLGKDKMICSHLSEWIAILEQDEATKTIVLIQYAQDIDPTALELLSRSISKPIIYYIVGSHTPQDRTLRKGADILHHHLSNSIPATSSYRQAIDIVEHSDTTIVNRPTEIAKAINQILTKV